MESSDLKAVPVDLAKLVEAMDMQGDESPFFYVLDTETGKVFEFPRDEDELDLEVDEEEETDSESAAPEPKWLRDASDEERAAFEAWEIQDERMEQVPPVETRQAYRLMAEFAETTEDMRLGEELSRAIRGSGAFRRFKDVLLEFPQQREKWFAFEAERKRQWAIEWLESIEIRPASLAKQEEAQQRTAAEAVATYPEPIQRLFELGDDSADENTSEKWPDYRGKYGIESQHIPDLIRLLDDAKFLFDQFDDETEDWTPESFAPIHAWRALGQLGAVEAARPMLEMVEKAKNETAYEGVPYALALLGPAVLPVVTEYLRSQRFDEWTRVAALDALVHIARRHPETRERAIEEMTATLRDHPINPESLNGLLVVDLVKLKGTQAAPVLREAYAAGTVDESMAGTWSEVRKSLNIKPQPDDPPDRPRLGFGVNNRLPHHGFGTPSPQPDRKRDEQKKKEKNKRKQAKKAKRQNRRR